MGWQAQPTTGGGRAAPLHLLSLMAERGWDGAGCRSVIEHGTAGTTKPPRQCQGGSALWLPAPRRRQWTARQGDRHPPRQAAPLCPEAL